MLSDNAHSEASPLLQSLNLSSIAALMRYLSKAQKGYKVSKALGITAGVATAPAIIYYGAAGLKAFVEKAGGSQHTAVIVGNSAGYVVGIFGGAVNFFFAAKGNEATFNSLFLTIFKKRKLDCFKNTLVLDITKGTFHWLTFGVISASGPAYYAAQACKAWGAPQGVAIGFMMIPWFFASIANNDYMGEFFAELNTIPPIRFLLNQLTRCCYSSSENYRLITESQKKLQELYFKIQFQASNEDIKNIYSLLFSDSSSENIASFFQCIDRVSYPLSKIILLRLLQLFLVLPTVFFGNISYYMAGLKAASFFNLPSFLGLPYAILLASFNGGVQFISLTNGLLKNLLTPHRDQNFIKNTVFACLINFLPSLAVFLQNIVVDEGSSKTLFYLAAVFGFLQTFIAAIYPINEQLSKKSKKEEETEPAIQRKAILGFLKNLYNLFPKLNQPSLEYFSEALGVKTETSYQNSAAFTFFGTTVRGNNLINSDAPSKRASDNRRGCGIM